MIEQIKIRDFQCHRRFDLELDPAVTVLVGSSDAGKSAVLRAFRWLAVNRPAGESFVAHGRDAVSVRVQVDGHSVKRAKGRGGKPNLFVLDGAEYAAFGQDVPTPVGELLNIDPALNLQWQHDPPFWFSLTPGEVARELNAVVNLSLIDRTLANAAAESRRVKAVIGVGEERLAKAKADAERLAWVREADTELQLVEAKEAELAENRSKIACIESIVADVKRTGARLDRLSGLKSDGLAAVQAGQKAIDAAERVENLQNVIQSIIETEGKLCEAKRKLADAERALAAVKVCPACGNPRS